MGREGDTDWKDMPKTQFYPIIPESGYVHYRCGEDMLSECLTAQGHGANLNYMSFCDNVEPWKHRDAALAQFIHGQPADVAVLIDMAYSWHPGDLMILAKSAVESGVPVGVLVSRARFGAGYMCTPKGEPTEDDLENDNYPIGTHDSRLYDMERPSPGILAIPRSCLDTIWNELRVDGTPFAGKLLAATKRSPDDVHAVSQLGMTAMELNRGVNMYDFFRPLAYRNEDGTWGHLESGWAFGERCKAAGITCQLSVRQQIVSWGYHGYSHKDSEINIDDFREYVANRKRELAGK